MLHLLPVLLPLLLSDPAPAAAPNDVPALLRAIPAEAMAVVSVPDLDALRADVAESAWAALLRDEAFQPLWQQLEQLEKGLGERGPKIDPRRVLASIHGPMALFVGVQPGGGGIHGGLLIEAGEEKGAFDGLFGTLSGMLDAAVGGVREVHGDATLLIFGEEGAGEESGMKPDHAILFQSGGLTAVIFGQGFEPTVTLARGVIDRHGSAAKGAGFGGDLLAQARGAGGPRRLEAVVDLQKAIALAMQASPPGEDLEAVLQALGVLDLRWAYVGAQMGKGEALEAEYALGLPQRGFLRQVVGMMQPYPQRLARMTPKDAFAANYWGFDLYGLWKAGWSFMESFDPEGTASAREQLAMITSESGIDLEEDLLSQFTGEFAVLSVPVPEAEWRRGEMPLYGDLLDVAASETMPGSAYLIGLKDPGIVQLFIEDALGIAGMSELLDSDTVDGRKVFSVEIEEDLSLSWTLGDRVLLVSMHPSAIRAIAPRLESQEGDSILEHPTFGRLLAANASATSVSVSSTATALRMMLLMAQGVAQQSGEGLQLLPNPGVVDRYFRGTLSSSMVLEGDDLRFSCRSH